VVTRRGGGGKPGKYLFTGLLVCDLCGASFTLRNREFDCCASHWHGAACSNTINVSRKLVQDVILGGIREDLADPEVIAEVERRVRVAVRRREQRQPKAADGKRLNALRAEIGNLTDAIAGGMLKSSPALAQRLQAAEAELARLEAARRPVSATASLPNVRKAWLGLIDRLEGILTCDPARGREELRQVLEDRVRLVPDESGKFLSADYALGLRALLSNADTVVAGA
jgi:hypothetical protein